MTTTPTTPVTPASTPPVLNVNAAYVSALSTYMDDLIATENLTQADAETGNGIAQRKRRGRTTARAYLAAATPARVDAPDPRTGVLESLRPATADAIAVVDHDRAKIEKFLNADRHILSIIQQADRTRCAAVLDWLDTAPAVLTSGDPEAAQAEIRGWIMDRLVALGEADAVTADRTARAAELTNAWADIMEAYRSGTRGSASALNTVYRCAPADYEAVLSSGTRGPADAAKLADALRRVGYDVTAEQQAGEEAAAAAVDEAQRLSVTDKFMENTAKGERAEREARRHSLRGY